MDAAVIYHGDVPPDTEERNLRCSGHHTRFEYGSR